MLRRTMYAYVGCICISALLFGGCASVNLAGRTPVLDASVAAADTSTTTSSSNTSASASCAATQPFQDQPPDDPHADPFGFGNWHINAERTLWVGIPPSGMWHTGGEKVIWIRPAGTQLRVNGQRLDAEAEPLVAEIPCCYPTGFQVTGLHFPSAGCWQINASAGDHKLEFIIEVQASPPQAAPEQRTRGIDPASPLATSVLLQLCNAGACELQPYDTVTGAATAGYEPLSLGRYATVAHADDLTQLALITYRDSTYLRDGHLSFVDLATWDVLTTTLTFDGAYNTPLFSADNEHLLVVTQTESYPASDVAHLVDVATGTLLAEQALPFYPMKYAFTADGSAIILYGVKGTENHGYVALLDANNLELQWQAQIEGLIDGQVLPAGSTNPQEGIWWQPATIFAHDLAHDKAALYIVHADVEQLTTVDFDTRTITTRTISERVSWIERLLLLTARPAYAKMANGVSKQAALSPDGSHLYVMGTRHSIENESEYVQTGLGLQVIELATGEISARINTEAQSMSVDLANGRLLLHGWAMNQTHPYSNEWTEIVDAETLEEVARLEKATAVAHRLDGTPVLLTIALQDNGQTELTVLNPQTLEVISMSSDRYRDYVGWVVMP